MLENIFGSPEVEDKFYGVGREPGWCDLIYPLDASGTEAQKTKTSAMKLALDAAYATRLQGDSFSVEEVFPELEIHEKLKTFHEQVRTTFWKDRDAAEFKEKRFDGSNGSCTCCGFGFVEGETSA